MIHHSDLVERSNVSLTNYLGGASGGTLRLILSVQLGCMYWSRQLWGDSPCTVGGFSDGCPKFDRVW